MKHIRIFEGFKKDRYYQKVDNMESPLLCTDLFGDYEWVNINSSVVDYLSSVELDYGWDISNSNRYRDVPFLKLSKKVLRNRKLVSVGSCIIFESSDEWFWVGYDYKSGLETYKCDQFEGLKKLLNDKGIVIEN